MDNKKIIFQVTRTYMMKNRKRTLVTFLGILVMVILMTAVFIGKDTVMGYMKNVAVAYKGSWHYQVYDIGKEEAEQIKALDFIDKFEVSKPLGYAEFPESGNPDVTPYLEVKEYSENLFELMNIKVKEGRYPKNSDEVIISEIALNEGADIKLGDTIEADFFDRYIHAFTAEESDALIAEGKEANSIMLPIGFQLRPGDLLKVPDHFPYNKNNALIEMIHEPTGLSKTLTVVGIMEEPYYGLPGQGGYIALTGTDNTVNDNDKINAVLTIDQKTHKDCFGEIAKILDTSKTPEEREAAAGQSSNYFTEDDELIPVENGKIVSNDMLLAFTSNGQDDSLNFLVMFCQLFFVVLITAASLVLIYNVFSMSYQERCRYLGMLSSVGATRSQKRWSVYYEAFSLLALALPLGICIGFIVVKVGMGLLYPYFSKLFGSLLLNVVMGRSFDIPNRIVINPLNILLVVIFSTAAVFISAWIPALKISKIGPVESIRGNENSMKLKKKGYKSHLGLMLKGKAEKLMGTASVERNISSTKGIIRSITAFTALTLITAFAAGSIGDILKSMENEESLIPGKVYTDCSYVFRTTGHLDEEWYLSGREDIMTSDEVSKYVEMDVAYYDGGIPIKYYNEEYIGTARQILEKWFPNATPEQIQERLFGDDNFRNVYAHPWTDIITLNDEDFNKIADRAGISLTKYEGSETGPVLIYDSLKISTQDCAFFDDDAQKPKYDEYFLKKPLSVNEGDTIELELTEYDEEQNEEYDFTVPVKFAGYIDADAIKEYFTLNDNVTFIFISEQTRDNIILKDPEFGRNDIWKCVFFNVNTEDSQLIGKLSKIEDEYGQSALQSMEFFDLKDFSEVVTTIANIVAVCFTLMIALICLLNLYNSVMGRCLARHKEMAVLHSMGMTKKQKNKMLFIENIRLLIKSFIRSALITSGFAICLYKLINLHYERVSITIPVGGIIITLLVSITGLMAFTKICYRHENGIQIIDEIRKESI